MQPMRVEFLKLNRNVMIATFIGMTEPQINKAISLLGTAEGEPYANLNYASKQVFNASSINNPGYTVVQLDRAGAVIPPSIKDELRIAVNNIATGVVTV